MDIKIPNYNWEMDGLLLKNGRARSAILIHDSIRYIRRSDLETGSESHVWITINLPAGRKLNVQSWYRQWQELGPNGRIMGTNTGAEVNRRMYELTEKWLEASKETEILSFSDTNINLSMIDKPPLLFQVEFS